MSSSGERLPILISSRVTMEPDTGASRRVRQVALALGVAWAVGLTAGVAWLGAKVGGTGDLALPAGAADAGGLVRTELKKGKDLSPAALACREDPEYAKHTLKLAQEASMFALLGEYASSPKYEASDVIVKGDWYYIVCDSSWSLYRIHKELQSFSVRENSEVEHMHKDRLDHKTQDSAYEGIFYDHVADTFFLVRESLPHPKRQAYHAMIEEVKLIGNNDALPPGSGPSVSRPQITHTLTAECPTQDAFTGDSKGFEGVVGMRDENGELYLLGLCEGNHCAQGKLGKERGNGVILVLKKDIGQDGACFWRTVRRMSVPASASFQDYSAISYNPNTGLVAITSQEESQLWVGPLVNPEGSASFHPTKTELGEGRVFDFPRNYNCETVYCNIEGVHWIADNMVVTVSDQAKRHGRQDFTCMAKDQSVHVFVVPL